ncbi:MAG: LUD domain-containing protein [Thermodesulfobacteriota bacterium]|nr:LUD domain-containing protein [Thermodesulfobacteriota bacterium]
MEKQENIKEYKARINGAIENDFLRSAMDKFAVDYRAGRANAFSGMDVDSLVEQVASIKKSAMENLDQLFKEFSLKAKKNGVHVHLAETAEEACRIITEIAEKSSSKKIIKSKSMTAEEIHLNTWLENQKLEVTETDLGEWIVQLRHEGPSHMVMPAIHLSRFQVADLFSDVTGKDQESEIEKLVKVARKELRETFIKADMGITGANYALADSGTIGLVTNEGNARLVTTLPGVHVALVGIDKLLPSITEALTINKILPRNATGQSITSYVTWITGPSQCTTTADKKREMHIVFLDNGRKKIAKDPLFSQILHCVRCGACANVCPVYRMVGGHALGYVYIGAIGLITTYFFHGRENAKNLVQNCTNCGACRAVCAAGIDLPTLIKEVHARIQDEEGHPIKSLLLAKVLKNRKLFHTLLRSASLAQRPVTGGTSYLRHLPMIFFKDQNFKLLPAITKKPFRDRFKELKPEVTNPSIKIALFSGCVQDFVYPEQLEAGIKAMAASGRVSIEFPMDQTCCGLPAVMMGEKDAARDVAIQNINAFKKYDVDYIVTLCASCASHLKNAVPSLAENFADKDAKEFADKIIPFSVFMNKIAKTDIPEKSITEKTIGRKIAWHAPCHLCRGLGIKDDPKELIAKSGNEYVPCEEEETCCGFGGSYSANFPAISREILLNKLEDCKKSGAEIFVTECPGCVMQLRGGALKNRYNIEVLHIAELIASTTPELKTQGLAR